MTTPGYSQPMAYIVVGQRVGLLGNVVSPGRVLQCLNCEFQVGISLATQQEMIRKDAEGFIARTVCTVCLPGLIQYTKDRGYPVELRKIRE
jgi:hypothetical protein